ncbi:unnamed protein product [Adineta ricciae]|uniref:Uncharacterized protein n=1 Tax=Adineta ricciae TaxID=249248 RepID=A0A815XJ28_ADIRI|nr:unnamed protein product [Adineta ricciae]CAF1558076.1 unnamed protein product [Adineta ricciae]
MKSKRNHSANMNTKTVNKRLCTESNEMHESGVHDLNEVLIQKNQSNTDADTPTDFLLRNKSNVWNYAHRHPTDLGWAICDLCPSAPAPKRISIKGGATSTLRKHLIKAHNKIDLLLVSSDDKVARKLPTIERNKLHQLLINAVIVDGRCFSDFRKSGFSRFLEYTVPGYKPPHSNTVRRWIKHLSTIHRSSLSEKLQNVEYMSITCDFWSNRSSKSFLVMTGHYLSKSFELNSTVIDFSHFEQRHFSDNVANVIYEKLDRLNVLGSVTAVTCDGASNMRKAFETLGTLDRLWCLGHRLHLIVTNALGFWLKDTDQHVDEIIEDRTPTNSMDDDINADSQDILDDESDEMNVNDDDDETEMEDAQTNMIGHGPVDDGWAEDVMTEDFYTSPDTSSIGALLRKCRALAAMMKRSSLLSAFFEKECSKVGVQRSLRGDVCTRWNSTLHMVESFLSLKTALGKLFDEKHALGLSRAQSTKLFRLELSSSDWNLLKILSQVLQPFDLATKLLSAQRYPTIGLCLFAIHHIKAFLEDTDDDGELEQRLKSRLLDQITKYIDDEKEQMRILRVYGYFDPMGFSVLIDRERTTVEREIKKLSSVTLDKSFDQSAVSGESTVVPNATPEPTTINAFLKSVGHESINTKGKRATLVEEIRSYRLLVAKFKDISVDDSAALRFWSTHAVELPLLSSFARRFLATPGTSVPSEAAFSASSFIGRKERCRLTADNLAATVFLKDKLE